MTATQRYVTRVKSYAGLVTQPDELTCQAACIHTVSGGKRSIADIRAELVKYGTAGDPSNMAETLRPMFKPNQYELHLQATMQQMIDWLKEGCVLITHGWFTRSGHVIVVDGYSDKVNSRGRREGFRVMDPYEEFFADRWDYPNRWGNRRAYNGYYSEALMYAACIGSLSMSRAISLYNNKVVDNNYANAWVHVIRPEKVD